MKKQSVFKKEEQAPVSIEPLFKEDQQDPWWHYKKYSQQEIEKISNYFTSNHEFLSKDLDTNVKQNVKIIGDKIGVHLPPLFTQDEYPIIMDATIEKKEGEFNAFVAEQGKLKTEEINEIDNHQFFILNSQKLDFVTIKILNIAFFSAKVKVLRINNNKFDTDTLNELIKMLQSHKIVKLFFDWNNIDECQNKEYFYEALFTKCFDLELISLRHQQINDQLLAKICDWVIENNQNLKLKVLDLFQNNFTNAAILKYLGLASLDKLLTTYTKLSYIGLGANNLSQLNPLIRRIGKKLLSADELVEYRKKEAERDAIVQKNAKQKGKNLEEVPFLETIKEIGQDKFAYCYNEQLQYLNLIQNQFSEQDKDSIEAFLMNAFEGFTLSLSGNSFEKKTIDRLKKKFGGKIFFY